VEDDLAELLTATGLACRLFPEQTQGPHHRDVHPERRDVTEDCDGPSLRLGLRFLTPDTSAPLSGVLVEVWQADRDGRYSGFQPFRAQPGQVVTSESVPHEIVAARETFLRGAQRTDERGMCAFTTIYPGWYASRTVHIHLIAHLSEHTVTTQLYFPDDVTDDVFTYPPYRSRPPRDTTNPTDSIFLGGGDQTLLNVTGDPMTGFTGVLRLALDPHAQPVSAADASPEGQG